MYLMKFFDNLSKKYSKNKLVFLSFSPQNKSNDNQYVVKQLKNVTKFSNKNDNNIALDGDYGTGKSSILNCLRDDIIWDFFIDLKQFLFSHFKYPITIRKTMKRLVKICRVKLCGNYTMVKSQIS